MASNKQNSSDHVALKATALALLAAAGVAFLYGTDAGKKSRKVIKGWTLKAKGEILDRLENSKDITETIYQGIVDSVAKKYQAVKKIEKSELDQFVKEMKGHWNRIRQEVKPVVAKAKKTKSAAKKVAKK